MEDNKNGKYRSAYSDDGMDDYAKLVRSTTIPKKKGSIAPKIIIAALCVAVVVFIIYKFVFPTTNDSIDSQLGNGLFPRWG